MRMCVSSRSSFCYSKFGISGRHYALNKKVLYFVTRDHIAGSHIVRNALA